RDVVAAGLAIGMAAGVRVAGIVLFGFAALLWGAVALVRARVDGAERASLGRDAARLGLCWLAVVAARAHPQPPAGARRLLAVLGDDGRLLRRRIRAERCRLAVLHPEVVRPHAAGDVRDRGCAGRAGARRARPPACLAAAD